MSDTNASQPSSTIHDSEAVPAPGYLEPSDDKRDPYLIDSFEEGDPANPKVRLPRSSAFVGLTSQELV